MINSLRRMARSSQVLSSIPSTFSSLAPFDDLLLGFLDRWSSIVFLLPRDIFHEFNRNHLFSGRQHSSQLVLLLLVVQDSDELLNCLFYLFSFGITKLIFPSLTWILMKKRSILFLFFGGFSSNQGTFLIYLYNNIPNSDFEGILLL